MTLLRYLRLYLYCLRFSFSKVLQFRLDFYFRVFMDCVFYGVNLTFFAVLYLHTDTVGGWDADQGRIFAAGVIVSDAINMTVFANNMWWLPIYVRRGDLDYYLVRPVSSLFFLSLREFAANSFFNLLIAVGVLWWALASYPGELAAVDVVVYVLCLLNGCVVYWLLHMVFLTPVFWTHSADGLKQLFMGFARLGERPDGIYRGVLHRIVVGVLPFALVVSYPTHILFEGVTVGRVTTIFGVTAVLFAALLVFWKRAVRAYSSASS